MTFAFVTLVLAQGLHVSVLDVSKPDAIYEDVSRALAEEVVTELLGAGFLASRVDESQLSRPCRIGPCLGEIAAQQHADVLVLLDAAEAQGGNQVALAAMRERDGKPLATAKYSTAQAAKMKKKLKRFAADVLKASREKEAPRPP